jgi:hypothetical protein
MSSAFNTPDNDAPALPLHQQFKDAFRATGYVTNGQAWELADAAMTVHRKDLAAAPTPPVDAVPGEPVAMGCHCDLDPDSTPDGCVLDSGRPEDCTRTKSGKITRREDCDEWKPIRLAASVASRAGSEPVAWQIRRRDVQSKWQHFDGHEADRAVLVANGWEERPLYAIAPAAAAEPCTLRDPRMEPFDRHGPFPGMIAAFELSYGQSWTDKDWRDEASTWARAWKAALADRERAASLVAREGMYLVGLCLDEDRTLHATVMRKEANGGATVLLSDYVKMPKGQDVIMRFGAASAGEAQS